MQTNEKRTFKNQLYEQFARIGKALASPHRLELLDVLAQCVISQLKLTVSQINCHAPKRF